jgi:hypothetical protein
MMPTTKAKAWALIITSQPKLTHLIQAPAAEIQAASSSKVPPNARCCLTQAG